MSNTYVLTTSRELYHYGVKGMKWGHRRAQKYEAKASAARKSAKEWAEAGASKAARLQAKGKTTKADNIKLKYKLKADQALANAKSYEDRAAAKKRGAAYQKKQAEAGASRSRGAKLATNVLAGPFANRTYNSVIAAGGTKTKARVMTAAATVLGGPVGHLVVSSLYRADASQKKD